MMKTLLIGILSASCLMLPLAASAQDVPSYATQPVAPYSADENIHGRISAFDGAYGLTVRDERGFIDNVQLHPGTIINPTGLALAPGMVVSILGYNAGPYFAANEIDTPYTLSGGVPFYAGHPWSYYGPSISLGFFFGNTGWWHGNVFGGNFRYVEGARVYDRPHIADVYRGGPGELRGRTLVAPAERGGYYAPRDRGRERGDTDRPRGGDRPRDDRGPN